MCPHSQQEKYPGSFSVIAMNILHVIPSVDPRTGGPVEAVRQLGVALQARGHRVEVASLDAPGEAFTSDFPLPLHALGPAYLGYRYCPKLVPWLRAHAKQYDAVIVDGLWQYNGFGTWRGLREQGVPYFVFPHGMNDPWFKQNYPFKHLKKWLYWPWAEYRVLRDAAAVIFTCEEERLKSRESFWLYQCHEEVTAFGTRLPPQDAAGLSAHFLETYPDLQGKRLLLFLGRMHEKKGCDLLVDAFSQLSGQHPDVHLVLVGPDDEGLAARYLDLARTRGAEGRVSWLGMLSGELKWGAFHASDAFVLPSHQENFGIAVAEAMGCCKPVLISNKVNIWREIEQGGGGLVEDDTLEGTRLLLQKWLAMSPEASVAMGERAMRVFMQRFTVDAMAQGVLQIIERRLAV